MESCFSALVAGCEVNLAKDHDLELFRFDIFNVRNSTEVQKVGLGSLRKEMTAPDLWRWVLGELMKCSSGAQ